MEKIARRVIVLEGKVEENMAYVKMIRIIRLHQRAVARGRLPFPGESAKAQVSRLLRY